MTDIYRCPECEYSVNSKVYLIYHLLEKHGYRRVRKYSQTLISPKGKVVSVMEMIS